MSGEISVDVSPVVNAIRTLSHNVDELNRNILLINSAIAALQATLVAQISDLKNTMVNVERQKLSARTRAYSNFLKEVKKDVREFEDRLKSENDKLKQEYWIAVNRELDRIKSEIKVNVDPMKRVLGEFTSIKDELVSPATVLNEELKNAYTEIYQKRVNRIEELQQKISQNFDNFLSKRLDLVHQIEELAVRGITIADNAILNIPFWVVGIHDGNSESIIVLPVLERRGISSSTERIASKRMPYVEHLRPSSIFSFEELTKEVGSDENVEIARRNKIRLEQMKEKFKGFLQRMCHTGLIHESFIEALEKFPGVYSDV